MILMDYPAVFYTRGQSTYRLRFPALLAGFDKTMLGENNGKFESDVREYNISGYTYKNAKYDIHVTEIGSDLEPARIEAFFYAGGKESGIPPELKEAMVKGSEETSRGRTLIYVNRIQLN